VNSPERSRRESIVLTARERGWALLLLALAVGARLLTLGAYPLPDPTEARYAEIGRKMAELGDWITPWFDWNVPFWGKPPLSFWLSAASMKLLGAGEFSARFPSFLLGLAMLGLVFGLMRRMRGPDAALAACLALATTALFFICSGAVLTDMGLAFAATLAMASFWLGARLPGRAAMAWRYAFFAALGIGLLAKGPVALPLVVTPLLLWSLIARAWRVHWGALPWAGGTLLMLAIALPWYVMAEMRTPGFIGYFLGGENFQRFLDSSWTGDLYGKVHTRPWGYIWLLFLASGMPWTPWLLWRAARSVLEGIPWRTLRNGVESMEREESWRLYLVLWMLTPALLFTFAGSVLATYVLPGIPAMALLAADLWFDRPAGLPATSRELPWLFAAAAVPALFVAALPLVKYVVSPNLSQGVLLSGVNPGAGPLRVAYFPERPFSGEFYSAGRALEARNTAMLLQWVRNRQVDYVVTRAGEELPAELGDMLDRIAWAGTRNATVLWAVRSSSRLVAADAPAAAGQVRARP
jgi:4-amino-4-deoxy-L-arabinose transferase-like glycosyltransferase